MSTHMHRAAVSVLSLVSGMKDGGEVRIEVRRETCRCGAKRTTKMLDDGERSTGWRKQGKKKVNDAK